MAVGTRFVTLATGREGRVLALSTYPSEIISGTAEAVLVGFANGEKEIHGDVRVRVVETLH